MKTFRYGLLGLGAFLLFLLVLAPATLITDRIGARFPGFTVQTVAGTATGGVMYDLQWRGTRIEKLSWNWQPLALATGRLGFRLEVADPGLKSTGYATLGWDRRWRFQDLAGSAQLDKLYALARQSKLPLQGMVEWNLRELRLNAAGRPTAMNGVIDLLGLRATLSQPLALGDVVIEASPTAVDGIQGQVQDRNGPLALQGTFNLLPDGRYRFNGQAAVRDAGNPSLRQALTLLGPPDGNGRWPLNFSGLLAW